MSNEGVVICPAMSHSWEYLTTTTRRCPRCKTVQKLSVDGGVLVTFTPEIASKGSGEVKDSGATNPLTPEDWCWENRIGGMFYRAGEFLGCRICGAVVSDQEVHYLWHTGPERKPPNK